MFLIKILIPVFFLVLAHIETFSKMANENINFVFLVGFIFFYTILILTKFKKYNFSFRSISFLTLTFFLNFINSFFINSYLFSKILLFLGFISIVNCFFVFKIVTILPLFERFKQTSYIFILIPSFLFSVPCYLKNEIALKTSYIDFKMADEANIYKIKTTKIKILNKFEIIITDDIKNNKIYRKIEF